MKKIGFYIAIVVLNYFSAKAQDPHFSQFYANPLHLSPSFTGAVNGSRLNFNYRDQWPELPGTFITYAVSYDHNFHSFNSGFGTVLVQDRAGSGNLSNTTLGLCYSYDFKVSRLSHIRPGLAIYYLQKSIDFNRLLFGSQIEREQGGPSVEVPPLETIYNVDASVSGMYYDNKIWAGFGIDHLLMPNMSFMGNEDRVRPKFSLYAGYKQELLAKTRKVVREYLTWAMHFKSQGQFNQLDIGAYFDRKPLIFGVWYRGIPMGKEFNSNDAVVAIIGYGGSRFSLIYSYDFTISKLVSHTRGAHEVSLSYRFVIKTRKKIQSPPCPHFGD